MAAIAAHSTDMRTRFVTGNTHDIPPTFLAALNLDHPDPLLLLHESAQPETAGYKPICKFVAACQPGWQPGCQSKIMR